jgi:hypothetical protein
MATSPARRPAQPGRLRPVPSTPASRAARVPGTGEWNGVFSVSAACRICSPLSGQSPAAVRGRLVFGQYAWLLPRPVTVGQALSLARSGRCRPGSHPAIASVTAWPLLTRRQLTPAARVQAVGLAGTWPQVVKLKRYEASRRPVSRVVYVRPCRRKIRPSLVRLANFFRHTGHHHSGCSACQRRRPAPLRVSAGGAGRWPCSARWQRYV